MDDKSTAEVEEELLMIWDSVEKVKAEAAEARKGAMARSATSTTEKSRSDVSPTDISLDSQSDRTGDDHMNQSASPQVGYEVEVTNTFWKATKEMGR